MKKNLKFKKIKLLLVSLTFFLVLVVLSVIFLLSKESVPRKTLMQYADSVIAKCKKSEYRPGCYDTEVPKLMGWISMEEAFEVTRIVQEKDSSFAYCHVLGHKLSEQEVHKDPSKWTQVLSRCPANGMCSNGCLHGAMQGKFRSESLNDKQIEAVKPELSTACEETESWNPTNLDQSICYHGLGHLTMYITNASFEKSISLCQDISSKKDGRNFESVCNDGLFMQLFQPLETEDFDLIKNKTPKKENLRDFCESFDGAEVIESCWRQGWPLMSDEIRTAEGMVAYCSTPKDPGMQDFCFNQLFHLLGQSNDFNISDAKGVCNKLQGKRGSECFANFANSMIQADKKFIEKAVEVCSYADKPSVQNGCYDILARSSSYNFNQGSEDLNIFCNKLPSKYNDVCYGKTN